MREEREGASEFCKRREGGDTQIGEERCRHIGREKGVRGWTNFVRKWKGGGRRRILWEKGGREQANFAREGREGQKEKKWKVNFVREGEEGAGELGERRRGGDKRIGREKGRIGDKRIG